MSPSLKHFATFSLLVFAAVGCDDTTGTASTAAGGSTSSSTSTGMGTGTSTATSGSSTSSGMTATCEPPEGVASAAKNLAFMSASGTVIDDQDMPVADLFLQLCGKNICLDGKTGGAGTYVINGGGSDMNRPFLKAGDGSAYAKIGFPVSAPTGTLNGLTTKLTDSMTELEAGAQPVAAGVKIALKEDVVVSFDIVVPDEPASHTFRASMIPAQKNETVAPGQMFAQVVALGPTETLLCPAAQLSVPNDAGLASGTLVEFWFQELSIEESFGTYGEWTKLATGVVSGDGATISTDAASGIPVLGVYGIKPAK